MLYISVSFDYELFMGKNYQNEENVLIRPTDYLLQQMKEIGVSGTYFVDVCCPMRYRELGQVGFPNMFDNQIERLYKSGNDIQLHIHPHWLKATKIGKEVEFDRKYFRIQNWANNGNDYRPIRELIHNGVNYIKSIIIPINPNYECIAYRAGGYCLQPEQLMADILYDEGIRIDSSVCIGFKHDGDGMYYDYHEMKKNNNYYIDKKNGLKDKNTHRTERSIFEVPVAGYSSFPFRFLMSRKNKKITNETPRGTGMKLAPRPMDRKRSLVSRIERTVTATNMLSFDDYYFESMVYCIRKIVKEGKCATNDLYISTIAHPKSMTKAHVDNLVNTISVLKNDETIRFVTMTDIARHLSLSEER